MGEVKGAKILLLVSELLVQILAWVPDILTVVLSDFSQSLQVYLWLYSLSLDLGRFFRFLILYAVGRASWKGLYLHTKQHKHRLNAHNTDIHVLSVIRTHDPIVLANEDGSCLRPRGHCDRPRYPAATLN
jgi:hypothetical protein